MKLWGTITNFGAATPAAGAEWSLTIPAGHFYTLLSFNAVLATGVTVANRAVRFAITDGSGNVVGIWGCGFTQVASQTLNYTGPSVFMGQTDPNGTFGSISCPMPALLCLPAGFTLASSTRNLQATDAWSAINGVWEDNGS